MLTHLVIRNFAIIHHLEVPFYKGLTVLSGETGAGKSIVIDALNLLLGGRASTDVIRGDADEAVVEGCFELSAFHKRRTQSILEELGVEPGDNELLIRRIIARSGRNKVFVNGCLTTLGTLQAVTSGLVDISGQHEHISLLDVPRHLDILDEFAALNCLRDEYTGAYSTVQSFRKELESLRGDVRERLHRIDFLKYQLGEIDAAKLKLGEDDELEAEFLRLKNAEKIGDSTQRATFLIYDGEASAVSKLSEASNALAKIEHVDPKIAELHARLNDARYLMEDVARELSEFTDSAESDPARLDAVQARLEALKLLKRKHGHEIAIILEEAERMREELDRLENAEERGAELEKKLEKAERAAIELAVQLSGERREAASVFARALERELHDLNMKSAKLSVQFAPESLEGPNATMLGAKGIDTVEFQFSPNPGESPKPLAKIASGGELSRIMLAMKTVLRERDTIATYIFDEVDTGIGGSTADLVGSKIAGTSIDHQVICITHLPQIASRGEHHYRVEKVTTADRTESTLRLLDVEERIEEIARMLGGARVSDKTRVAAQELLGL
jgi:DNA repair protein RecN (Recombination protein N)